jgi:hypothetical protein
VLKSYEKVVTSSPHSFFNTAAATKRTITLLQLITTDFSLPCFDSPLLSIKSIHNEYHRSCVVYYLLLEVFISLFKQSPLPLYTITNPTRRHVHNTFNFQIIHSSPHNSLYFFSTNRPSSNTHKINRISIPTPIR